MPPTWRVWLSTALLCLGVVFVSDVHTYWRVVGGLLLAFVPTLIAEYALAIVRPRRFTRMDLLLMLDQMDRAEGRSTLTHPETSEETSTPESSAG